LKRLCAGCYANTVIELACNIERKAHWGDVSDLQFLTQQWQNERHGDQQQLAKWQKDNSSSLSFRAVIPAGQ